jgi:ABC-2 type transport system ATP-binding protein
VIAPTDPIISVSHLTKRYGDLVAVSDVSFEVGKGEIVGFLGPNGAGKSTTLRILAGFLGQTRGNVSVCGHDVALDSLEARKSLGYMPESVPLYPEMRVVEYLAFRAEVKRIDRKLRARAVETAMEKAGVTDRATSLIGKLSKGYRQRVGLADALVGSPPLLILDEPTSGLDPNQIREVRKLLREIGKEHTVLLSTHILGEVESSCTRAIVIAKGKLVAQGSIDEIRRLRRSPAFMIVVRGDAAKAEATVAALDIFSKITCDAEGDATTLRCTWKKKVPIDEAAERVIAALVNASIPVRSAAPEQSRLEDVFAELTDGEPAAASERPEKPS